MDVTYLLCDILTGRVLTELPLTADETIKRMIARVETQTFNLPVLDDRCPNDWASLLIDGKSMIVLTLDNAPTQGWVVDDHEVGDVIVPITALTLENCLARTNVPELEAYGMDMSAVAAALVAELVPRFGFTIDYELCGKTAEEDYSTLEDRNVLEAINALMTADGGPEWRTRITWADDNQRAIAKSIEIRPKIGIDRPDAIFDLDAKGRGTIETYRRRSSFAAGKGATMLIGTSEGSGASRPMTDPVVSPLVSAGWPVWEERKNFTGLGSGEVDEDTELNSRTAALSVQRERGTTTWTVTGSEHAPVPGRDFTEGDTVHIDVAPQGKLDPLGGTAAVRALGWELSPKSGRGSVIVWDDGSESDG